MSATRVAERWLPAMTPRGAPGIVPARVQIPFGGVMETTLTPQIDLDEAADRRTEEERRVHSWRVDQLGRLGLSRSLAEGFAGAVDWHDVAGRSEERRVGKAST